MKRKTAKHRTVSAIIIKAVVCMMLLIVSAASLSAAVLPVQLPKPGRTVDPTGSDEGYSCVLYNNTNGLPTSEANDIAETSDGFIWIGSYSGLIRYDGNTFERVPSSSGITSVNCLYVDSRDRLWIGTNESGIVVMEKGSFRMWGRKDGMRSVSVRSITEDESGTIYAGTTGGIALIDSQMNIRFMEDPYVYDAYVTHLQCGYDGQIYGVTNTGDAFTLRNGEVRSYFDSYNSPFKGFSVLYPDAENPGYVYFATPENMVYYGRLGNEIEVVGKNSIGKLKNVGSFSYIDGRLWITARNGIGVLDQNGFHALDNVPMNNSVGKVMADYEGNLWFTSTRQGVMKIVPNRFTDLFDKYDLPEAVVNSTCLMDGHLFIGTDDGLIIVDHEKKCTEFPVRQVHTASGVPMEYTDLLVLLDECRIRSIIRDSRDRLWFSTYNRYGLIRYDHGDVTIFTVNDGLISDKVRTVVERENGSILAAASGGVCEIRGDEVVMIYREDSGITNTEILTVEEGENGDVLIGTDGGGIFIIKELGTSTVGMDEGLTSEAVMRIKYDEEFGVYWVVTGNSIGYLTEDYKLVTVDQFPYSNNFDLYKNSRGEMWILSSNGIYVVPAKDMIRNQKIPAMHYGRSNGLPCITTANSYSELDEDGNLYIAGTTGAAKVNIEATDESTAYLKASVPYIEADGERIYPDENNIFTVSADVKKVTIYGFVYNYFLINPNVTYYLDKFDTEPVTVPRSDFDPVSYTNLPGGTYHFVIELSDQSGEQQKVAEVGIIKKQSYYESPWFYVFTILAIGALLIIGFRAALARRIRNLESRHQEEVEKERIRTELSTASQIQESVLPHVFPPYPDRSEFDIFAVMKPAREVGGDFYDFFLIDDDHLGLVIADVSGKGIPAALFMMEAKRIVRHYAMFRNTPAEVLSQTNKEICSSNKAEMFVTVWFGILEISSGKLTAANAGHEYPVIRYPGGEYVILKDKHGFVIGGLDEAKYKEYEIELVPGSRIFVYTDGVPEATDTRQQMFTTDRLLHTLNKDPDAPPGRVLQNVSEAVKAFVGDAEQFDDLTMMCIDYKGTKGQEQQL